MVAEAENAGGDRGPEREVEPAERPAGDDDRDDGVNIPAKTDRDPKHGSQRGNGARASRRRLGKAGDYPSPESHAGQQQGEDEMGRRRCELDQRAAGKRPQGQAADRRNAVDQAGAPRRMGRVQVDQRGSDRGERDAGGDALHEASKQKGGDTSRSDEHDEGRTFKRNRRGQERAATDVIGKATEYEQRTDQDENVDREDHRQRRVGKTPLSLIDDVQRRRRARRCGEEHKDGGDRREGDRARQTARAACRPDLMLPGGYVSQRVRRYLPAISRRAAATMSALVLAWPWSPQPPSGDSVIRTQVRSVSFGSPPAAATISVSSLTTPSCLSRSRTPTGVRTCTRT